MPGKGSVVERPPHACRVMVKSQSFLKTSKYHFSFLEMCFFLLIYLLCRVYSIMIKTQDRFSKNIDAARCVIYYPPRLRILCRKQFECPVYPQTASGCIQKRFR